ncbi:MAG: hypothetical protein H0X64_12830 [Gemmatimonadaceae bacterium]|nr:hypothetical protein [Gemmatimonadaceae bacterium]
MPTILPPARRRALLALALMASAGATGCLTKDLTTPRPSRLESEAGNAQTVAPLARTNTPLMVQVFDQFRQVLPGQTVTWRVESGGGSVSNPTTVTNSNGIAQTFYTAGGTPGLADISATVAGLGTITFTVTIASPSGS